MNPFTEHSTTRFCADLPAALQAVDGVRPKAKAAAAALAMFLNAHSFANVSLLVDRRQCNAGRFAVPHPIFVRICNTLTTESFGRGPESDKHLRTVGQSSRFEICDNWYLVVDGAELLFKKSPGICRLCEYIGAYLGSLLNDLIKSPHTHTPGKVGSMAFLTTSGDGLGVALRGNPKLVEPLIEALEILNDSTNESPVEIRPRWVWLAKARPTTNLFPYVYLHWPASREMPMIANPDGEGAIVHVALEEGTPRIVWNYPLDEAWTIPKEIKDNFKRRAQADKYPHLLYVPVLRWLAIQRSFGPSDNPLLLLDQCEHFAGLAPVVMLNCFEEALFKLILELFLETPTLNPDRIATDEYVAGEIKTLIQFILDFYPVPLLKLSRHEIYPRLQVKASSDRLSSAFALHGNGAIRRAIQAATSHAQMRDYKIFGSTLMGTIHTLKRPLENMLSYAERVKGESLSPSLQERTLKIIDFLSRQEVFANLDVAALTPIFEEKDSVSSTQATPIAILETLRTAGYDDEAFTPDLDFKSIEVLSAKDPGQQLRVQFRWHAEIIYRGHAGPLALIIAELVDNAAKYLRSHSDADPESRIDVAMVASGITVTNPITLADKPVVEERLERARKIPGRSLSHILHLADLMGLNVSWSFEIPEQIQFTCSHTL